MYRLAIVLLADASLEFGMKVWSRRLIEEIMPQVRPTTIESITYSTN